MSQPEPQCTTRPGKSAASMLEDTIKAERESVNAGGEVAATFYQKFDKIKELKPDLDLDAVFAAAQVLIMDPDMLGVLLLGLNLPPAQSPEAEARHTEIAKAWACTVAGHWAMGEHMKHTGLSIPLTESQLDEVITRCAKIREGA
jgi:hypothetical protein